MSASRPQLRARDAVRLRAAVLVTALALGQLGTFLHQAAVSHTRCAEHGELTHGEPHDDASAGEASVGVAARAHALGREDTSPRMRALPESGEHAHEHCWTACAERARDGADGEVTAAPPPATDDALARAGAAIATRSLYRTAPKTSPPA